MTSVVALVAFGCGSLDAAAAIPPGAMLELQSSSPESTSFLQLLDTISGSPPEAAPDAFAESFVPRQEKVAATPPEDIPDDPVDEPEEQEKQRPLVTPLPCWNFPPPAPLPPVPLPPAPLPPVEAALPSNPDPLAAPDPNVSAFALEAKADDFDLQPEVQPFPKPVERIDSVTPAGHTEDRPPAFVAFLRPKDERAAGPVIESESIPCEIRRGETRVPAPKITLAAGLAKQDEVPTCEIVAPVEETEAASTKKEYNPPAGQNASSRPPAQSDHTEAPILAAEKPEVPTAPPQHVHPVEGLPAAKLSGQPRPEAQTVEIESRTPAGTFAVTRAIEEPRQAQGPVRDISLQLSDPAGKKVDLRFADRDGGVVLTVRSSDARLSEALGARFPELERGLQERGWTADLESSPRTHAGHAAATESVEARTSAGLGQQSHFGRGPNRNPEWEDLEVESALRRLGMMRTRRSR